MILQNGCATKGDKQSAIDHFTFDFDKEEKSFFKAKKAFLYLVDKLPKFDAYHGFDKPELIGDLDDCSLSNFIIRLRCISSNLRYEFRSAEWKERFLSSSIHLETLDDVVQFIKFLDESVNWDKVDEFNLHFWALRASKKERAKRKRKEIIKALKSLLKKQCLIIDELRRGGIFNLLVSPFIFQRS